MKSKWIGNAELQKYAEADPPRAYMITQTVKTTASDIKDTRTDWNGGSGAGFTKLESGGATLAGSNDTKITISAADTADAITAMPGLTGATVGVAVVQWGTAAVERTPIFQLIARLDPNQSGGGVEVTHWRAQLWRIAQVDTGSKWAPDELWDLEPLTHATTVAAGSVVSDVTFTFARAGSEIGDSPAFPAGVTGSALVDLPTTVIVIEALKGAGAIASNVAWIGDTAASSETNSNHTAYRFDVLETSAAFADETFTQVRATIESNGLPRFQLIGKTFSAATITFGSTSNRIDLGAAPTNTVEFVVEAEEPGGASVVAAARVVGGSTVWTTVVDGDTAIDKGLTGSTAGEYHMRATLTPSTDSTVAPTIRRLGAREVVIDSVPDQAILGNPVYTLNPNDFKTSIPALDMALRRDLRDHRDFASALFSDNHAGDIEFRVWYGSTALARQYWMPIDNFRLHNYESAQDPILVQAIHPLALTKQTIPVASTAGQIAVTYSGTTDTAKTIYADLLDRVSLAGRYKGVLMESTSTVKLGKTISAPRPMKDELARVAYIEGGAVIPSQGRLKWKRIFTTTGGYAPDADLTVFEDIEPIRVSPNLDRRIVSFRAPYLWSEDLNSGNGGYASQVFQTSTSAVSKLGHAALGSHQDLEDETAKYLLGSTYATAIAGRTVAGMAQGMVLVSFRTPYPHPWVELGDPASVPTNRFVGRGLETDRAIKGRATFYGAVVEHDMNGTEFTVWVPDLEGYLPTPDDSIIDYGGASISIVDERQVALTPSGGNQRFNREVIVIPDEECQSYKISYVYAQTNEPPASPTFIGSTYNVDVTAPGLSEKHTLQTSTGGDRVFLIRNTTWGGAQRDLSFTLAVTPYSRLGGSTGIGTAGKLKTIFVDDLGVTGDVGVRATVTGSTTDVAGYRLVAGSGISLSWSTGGDIVISTT